MLGENTAWSDKTSAPLGRTPAILCDRFVLEERLEHGRIGTMYRALDRLRALDGRAYVAVLILPAEIVRSAEQLAAFERELDIVRMLSHPNIVRIFSLERDGDIAFLLLEWVDGESLRSVMQSLLPETVCEEDALGVVRAVGNALVYAHARGIVHGDIRPENVLVTARGEVRLLFTPACFARTAPFTIGPRDDVRGLAALAYELVAGAPPPVPGLYPRTGDDELEPVEGLSRKRFKALKSALSMRDGRISSVTRLLAALDLPEPRAPRRGGRPDRVRDVRRGRFTRVALGAAGIAGIAVLAAGGWQALQRRPDSLPDLGTLPRNVESGASRAADLAREGLSGAKTQLEQAGTALAALLRDVGERIEAASERSAVETEPEAVSGAEPDALPGTELFERKELNGTGDLPSAFREPGGDETLAAGGAPNQAEAVPVERADALAVQPGLAAPSAEESPSGTDADAPRAADGEEAARAADSEQTPRSADGPTPTNGAEEPAVQAEPEPASPATERGADRDTTAPRSASRVRFSRSEYVVSESDGFAAIEVERADARGDVAFVWWTRDGTATSGDDYADLGRKVERLRDGERATVLYVPITSDSIVEARQEYFEIMMGAMSPDGNQSGALESARVTIVDDDR